MPKKTPKARTIHYVLSSHWDREWYETFQDFRRRLVRLLDGVLADLGSGKLRGPFTTDGQAIVIEDYLEIRPKRRATVVEYLKNGKLRSGPWYVLPDEWLVSGESLIRNLQLGRKTVRDLGGKPSNAGFVCDLFGHIGQLPQIFRGFGITGALIWRGVEPRDSAQILWRGSDGSTLNCYRFGEGGYCDYGFAVRRISEPQHEFDEESARVDLMKYLDREAARNTIPPILAFDGADHLEYDARHYRILFGQKTGADFPYKVLHSTLDDYLKEMQRHGAAFTEEISGELREAGRVPFAQDMQWLIPGVLSSRVNLKQANAECESLLCHWAEPFSGVASVLAGKEYIGSYLQAAWRWLIMNHPHDSICGCSIDEVHEDMKYRFAQCRQIAVAQTAEALKLLAASVAGEIGEDEMRVLVFNPVPSPSREPTILTLQIPADWPCFQEFFGFERKPAFRLFDSARREVPYQLLAQDLDRVKRRDRPDKFAEVFQAHDVTICANLDLPALGYTTLTLRKGKSMPGSGVHSVLPVRHPQVPGLATSERSMENEFLAVTIGTNGTLTIEDKRSGHTFDRLLTFEDIADIGDGWYHGQAVNDQKFISTAASSEVSLIHDGSLFCRFRIRTTLQLPQDFDFSKGRRSEVFRPVVVDSTVSLRAGCDRIEIETAVDNTCKDHRLRMLFPTGVKAETYFADGAFDVLERKIALPEGNHLGRELSVETSPQQTWTAAVSAKRGLAVVSTGLLESAVCDLPERPIALTLFRSTGRTFMTNGQPDGQLQGPMKFRCWIVPLAGAPDRRRLFELGTQIAAGLRTSQMQKKEQVATGLPARLPATDSFLQVRGEIVTSSQRRVANGFEIRLFNPNDLPVRAALNFSKTWFEAARIRRIMTVNFDGKALASLKCGSHLRIRLLPKQILTLRLADG